MGDSRHETQGATATLPEFASPPINELVCGTQLERLEKWQTPHFGLFWARVREEYPEFQDQNPLTVLSEPTNADLGKSKHIDASMVPLRRVWLMDQTRRYVMQVDPPRFLHNWRRLKEGDEYPRFQTAYKKFTEALDLFRQFVRKSSLGVPRLNQYELSYINHIVGDQESPSSALYEHLSCYRWDSGSRLVGKPEGLQMSFRVPLQGKRGALVVSVKSGTRKSDNRHVLILDLTARGSADPAGGDMQEWYDFAHETIVRGFVELTTSEAHKAWGRTV